MSAPAAVDAAAADARWMAAAIAAGGRGGPAVRPNPQVGCALVRNGAVLGLGWHQRCGGPHAEIEALRAAQAAHGPDAGRGATAYVTLEPCNHHGRTPPCVDALLAAGVARVVVAVRDPNPVAAGGLERLAAAGVAVEVGVGAAAAARLIEGFVVGVREGRALLRLKMAASLDGHSAAADGGARWLTGEAARARVHAMRAAADAVLVGSGTVLADDPRLDARDVGALRQPLRVILDRRLRTPLSARVADTALAATRIYTAPAAATTAHAAALRAAGVEVVGLNGLDEADAGACREAAAAAGPLRAVLVDLRARGQHEVLCEGGATLAAALWREGVVDRLELMLAPLLLGAGAGLWPGLGVASLATAPRLQFDDVSRVGDDLHVSARPLRADG